MTAQDALSRLQEGNQRFVNDTLVHSGNDQSRRAELAGGQKPYAIILSCADSRVVPEMAFDTGLGEIFVIRVAGNVANSSTIASIEYAVAHLGTELIVVLGHQACGAVTAAVQGGDNGYNLNHLLSHITPAIAASSEGADVNDVVKKNAELTAQELSNRSAIIGNAVREGKVMVKPAYYQLDNGEVKFL